MHHRRPRPFRFGPVQFGGFRPSDRGINVGRAARAIGRPPRTWRPRASPYRGRSSLPLRVDTEWERRHYWTVLRSFEPRARRGAVAASPGVQSPASHARALPELAARRYGITLKSDGVRYSLMLTLRPGSTREAPAPVALMVDRSRGMYEVEVLAPEAYFVDGTLLEGELVWRQPHERDLLFLVFDAVRVKGEPLAAAPFGERMRRAEAATRFSEEIAAVAAGEGAAQADAAQRALEVDCVALVHYDPPPAMRPGLSWSGATRRAVGRPPRVRAPRRRPHPDGPRRALRPRQRRGRRRLHGMTTQRSTSRAAAAARCAPPTRRSRRRCSGGASSCARTACTRSSARTRSSSTTCTSPTTPSS